MIGRKVKEAQFHLAAPERCAVGTGSALGFIARIEHDFEAASQRPKELQHGNIERRTRHGQPRAARVVRNPRVHSCKKVEHIAVFDHDALGFTGRAGGINYIGQMMGRDTTRHIIRRPSTNQRPVRVQTQAWRFPGRQCGHEVFLGEEDPDLSILDHKSKAIGGISRVEGEISGS